MVLITLLPIRPTALAASLARAQTSRRDARASATPTSPREGLCTRLPLRCAMVCATTPTVTPCHDELGFSRMFDHAGSVAWP